VKLTNTEEDRIKDYEDAKLKILGISSNDKFLPTLAF
jgi:hypothetical protein